MENKGEDVAVKKYTSFSGANSIEAQLFAKFSSSYIVRFYGVCYSINALVLEYCPLGSVEQCYYNQEMTEEVKALICYDFARAIKYFHDNNHIHRDLKPDNLLMCSFSHDINVPRAKLSDFGTGKVSFKQEKNSSVQGTPAFIAPEVLTGTFDKKCDVYSFGMSMWSIFAEKQPYEDEALCNVRSEEDYYNMIRQGIRPTLVSKCPLNELVVKCWDTDPSKRPTFNEIAKVLLKTIIATQKAQNAINSAKKDAEMAPLLELFGGNKKGANKFLKLFCGSPSDAVTFIKAFKDIRTAEKHLEELNNECDEITGNSCGMNCKWISDEKTGTLFIRGEGTMASYEFGEEQEESTVPWTSFTNQIKHVVIDQRITTIGSYAFYNCSLLSSITIPDTVTIIGSGAFSKCTSLETITLPESVTMIGERTLSFCSSLTSITIPNSVTVIGESAFHKCSSLTSITIPNSVTAIGNGAFWNCSSLTSITIPDGVTTIGADAFDSCSSLTSITIPNSVTTIGGWAFSFCSSLTSITLPESVTTIGGSAFHSCSSLTSITIPNSVTAIGEMTFYKCSSLTSITVPNGVTTIGGSVFEDCSSLISITVPNGVTEIGERAFYHCSSLTSITIPNSVTTIGEEAFYKCSSLTFIIIPNSVTTIERFAIHECSSLTTATLPKRFESQKDDIFYKCDNLKTINWTE